MSVWFCIPSKKTAAECNAVIDLWRSKGYKVAVWRDEGDEPVNADIVLTGEYPGYAQATNWLCQTALNADQACNWVVAAGDDTEPDPRCPEEIANECAQHFGGTFGVMQPTGDEWSDAQGRIIERIAGSPWLGRDWCMRANQGRGPFWPGYPHCFSDNELQEVAQKYGVFWQRPDVTHYHRHWMREKRQMPGYLREANSQDHWQKYFRLFRNRKASGYPGSEPIAA